MKVRIKFIPNANKDFIPNVTKDFIPNLSKDFTLSKSPKNNNNNEENFANSRTARLRLLAVNKAEEGPLEMRVRDSLSSKSRHTHKKRNETKVWLYFGLKASFTRKSFIATK